jgi:flagellar assembly factor FliW
MIISTLRFGQIEVTGDHIFVFPDGLIGFEKLRHLVLLADEHERQVVWLQALSDARLAFAAISPRCVVPDYRVRVTRQALSPLGPWTGQPLHVLCLLSVHGPHLCVNLKAPILIDQQQALGCQVMVLDDWPIAHPIAEVPAELQRQSA